jgi:SAM-dependent methyltransferase
MSDYDPTQDYWDNLMCTDEGAASYMETYGEGIDTETRRIIGSFINDGEYVLDVGCGPAWNYDHFAEYGPKVIYTGCDLSPRFVRVANKRIKEKYGNEPICIQDCRDLGYPDGSFDVVILQDVLEHTNGYEKPVYEALRVSRKRIIICFWRTMENVVTKTNDDTDKGTNGYGSDYNLDEWLDFLNSLDYPYLTTETSPQANRQHWYYIINKENENGA